MKCNEFRRNLSLYVDDALASAARAACDVHLDECPVCRAELAHLQDVRRSLRALVRPAPSEEMTNAVRRAVAVELVGQKALEISANERRSFTAFFEHYLMPYAVGTLTSLLFFVMMFTALRVSMTAFREFQELSVVAQSESAALTIEKEEPPRYSTSLPFSAADYAALRSSYATESPSINPKSSFVSFTSSVMRRNMTADDTVVVVADVFSNGLAQVAEVLDAPTNEQSLADLERILQSEPAFVPASYDKRPENLRVVFLIQKVEVKDSAKTQDAKPKAEEGWQ